jgi:hypothetical protein
MVKEEVISDFFDSVLKGESKTYNDYNWYTSGGLRSYIQGQSSSKYPYLKKPLSEYTIGEIKAFQSKPRDANGQLWATGKYQIIPQTLKGLISRAGLKDTDLYNKANQDKLGFQLLLGRKAVSDYINGRSQDTLANLENASLDIAKIWASVGVPFPMKGAIKQLTKNQSYYSGGGDRATTDTEVIQNKLKELRKVLSGKAQEVVADTKQEIKDIKKIPIGVTIITAIMIIAGFTLYTNIKTK